MLLRTYEQLIVQASLDNSFGAFLLTEPRAAALGAGYSQLVAESLVGLKGATLAEFSASLHRRVYGTEPSLERDELISESNAAQSWGRGRIASTA